MLIFKGMEKASFVHFSDRCFGGFSFAIPKEFTVEERRRGLLEKKKIEK